MKVGIEWGHFAKGDVGAVYEGRREYDDNLRLSRMVGELLERQGFEVYYPKEKHSWKNNEEKFRLINEEAPDVYLSFHRNAYNGKARGYEIYTRKRYSEREERLAKCIHEEIVKIPGVIDRGVKRKDFEVCTRVNYPAVLTETLFLDNDADNRIYDGQLQEIARAYARGVCAYSGIPYEEKDSEAQDHTQCDRRMRELEKEIEEIEKEKGKAEEKLARIEEILKA